MVFSKRKQRGFTLIEIMVVIVIIGVLAAMAIPRFMRASTKTRQSEANQILKQIYVNQRTYRQQDQTNSYYLPGGPASAASPDAFSTIWIEIMSGARYTFTIVGTANTFTATATADIDDDPTVDTWTMDENGILTNTINDVLG